MPVNMADPRAVGTRIILVRDRTMPPLSAGFNGGAVTKPSVYGTNICAIRTVVEDALHHTV